MKTKSALHSLSQEDQAYVIELCRNHTYAQAVALLAQARPTGLSFKTSVSALNRFYALYHPTLYALHVDRQSIDILKNENDTDLLRVTLFLIQQRIFRSFLNGGSLDQILPALRFMLRLRGALQNSDQDPDPAIPLQNSPDQPHKCSESRLQPATPADHTTNLTLNPPNSGTTTSFPTENPPEYHLSQQIPPNEKSATAPTHPLSRA